jgi:hypothetical protein
MSEFEIVISSPPDRLKLVAEIFFSGEQFAELNQESEEVAIEIYPRRDGKPWNLFPEQVTSAIAQAALALKGEGKAV